MSKEKKSTNRSALYRGLSALMAFIMFISCTVTNLTFQYDSIINQSLGIETTYTVASDDEDEDSDSTIYYANDYGYDENALVEVNNDAAGLNVDIAEEGVVLLMNNDDALPLDTESTGITIFGNASVNGGLYSTTTASYLGYVSLASALQDEFGTDNVNTVLCDNVYSTLSSSGTSSVVEADIEDVKAYEDTWQDEYNDVAVVVFGRSASEGNDLYIYSTTETYDDGTARRMLDLSENEEALMEYLQEQKEAGVFDKIVVIIASENQMELDFLYEYDVDAALMAGELGTFGCTGLAEILGGDVNPSGHLVDTYAADSTSAPAVTYASVENTLTWTNSDEVNEANPEVNDNDGGNIDYYLIYAEGIYVGYRYYETRYEDSVMGTGNADSEVGSSYDEAWNYADEMVYTFGYGLSYTTFEQTLDSVDYDEDEGIYTVTVTVTNTGSVAGKDVVEVYAQTPYGEYEEENLIEKASIQLVAYDKTDTIEPGESETLTIEVEEYFLASYDSNGYETYILSAGDYYLAIGDDAHDALNNILAAKGYTSADGMVDAEGNAVDGDASKTYSWTQDEIDAETYSVSVYTDVEVTNLFDAADINYYGYDFTYLSRSDWEATYPDETLELEATEAIIESLSNYDYEEPEDSPSVDDYEQGVDNGLTLADMVYVDFDDELWDDFIDQLTVEQMANLWTEGASTQAVAELDIPGWTFCDDDTNPGGQFKWVSHPTSARAWNLDLHSSRGTYEGLIAQLNGKDVIFYGTANLHRTPFGGRSRQYFSEDPIVDYYAGYAEAAACQATGTVCCVKHFATNDQETARTGVSTFMTEQTLREIYLRAFEGSFQEGGALSTMIALNRIGTRLAKNYDSLITGVLKEEWGFEGNVTHDCYVALGYYQNTMEQLAAGLDYADGDSSGWNSTIIIEAIEEGDGNALALLRETAHRNLYVMSRTAAMNGLGSGGTVVTIVPTWETALMIVNLVSAVLFVVFAIASFVSGRKKKDKSTGEVAAS